jgi:Phospholipase_D-nuclease N-terminal
MIFAEWQVGQVFWSMVWLSLFFLWIWVVITVFADIIRSPDLSNLAKAVWTVFVVFFPVVGVVAYLIVRGGGSPSTPVGVGPRGDAEYQAMRQRVIVS